MLQNLGSKSLGTLTPREITDFIRNNNINAKVGWLLPLVSGHEIYEEYQKLVLQLMDLRNQIVHFKAIPLSSSSNGDSGDSSYDKIQQEIDKLDFKHLLAYPKSLSAVLDQAIDAVRSDSDYGYEYDLAKKTTMAIVKQVQD